MIVGATVVKSKAGGGGLADLITLVSLTFLFRLVRYLLASRPGREPAGYWKTTPVLLAQ